MKLTNRRHSLRPTMQASDSAAAPVPSAIALPAISDASSIQRAIAAVVLAAAEGTLEAPRARVLLYGLQIAATNARHIAAERSSEHPAAEHAEANTEVVSAAPEREMPQSDSADVEDAASTSTAAIETMVEGQAQQKCSIDAEEATVPQATEAEAQQPEGSMPSEQIEGPVQPEDPTQIEQHKDAGQPVPSAAIVEEVSQAATPPVVGYTSNMQSRLLAFRQGSATS